MEDSLKKSIVNRICTGIVYLNINDTIYYLDIPSKQQKAISELVYSEVFQEIKYKELMTRKQSQDFLANKGIWTQQNDKQLEDLNKYLEDLKIQLYDNLYNDRSKKKLRSKIKSLKSGISKSLIKKYSLDHMTLEAHAEDHYNKFLTAICIKDCNGVPVYTYHNWKDADSHILKRFLNYKEMNALTNEQYREISRTEPFRSIWGFSKHQVFGSNSFDFTNDQMNLCMYSRMYDNVYENPDRPSDEVIDDDDMLDGWFAKQRRQIETDRKKKEVDSIMSKGKSNSNAGEMFVMAGSKQEANKIRGINDIDSKMRMKQRSQALSEKGKLEESKLPDVQIGLRNEAMRQMADRFKK
jgi:hypothetical protein